MPVVFPSFDLQSVEWRRVTDPSCTEYKIDFEYSLLGYDVADGRLDMLLRYAPNGHCRPHRHVANTVTLVLEGEQFLSEMLPDGTTRSVHRRRGDYAMAAADALPHDEYGGANGGTVMLSMATRDGILFEYFDQQMQNPWTLSLQEYVDSWERGVVHGTAPTVA